MALQIQPFRPLTDVQLAVLNQYVDLSRPDSVSLKRIGVVEQPQPDGIVSSIWTQTISQTVTEKRFSTSNTATGASIGLLAGALGSLFTSNPVPLVVAQYAVAGGVVGGVAGACVKEEVVVGRRTISTVQDVPGSVENNEAYLRWRVQQINTHVVPLFEQFREHGDVREFRCGISNDLIHVPLEAPLPDGRTYEEVGICRWIRTRRAAYSQDEINGMSDARLRTYLNSFSPIRACHYTETDLQFDRDYHPALIQRLRTVYNRTVRQTYANASLSEGLGLGVRPRLEQIVSGADWSYGDVSRILIGAQGDRLVDEMITQEQHQRVVAEIMQRRVVYKTI
jgi:hypothetical protein